MKRLLKKFRSKFHNDIHARLDKMEYMVSKHDIHTKLDKMEDIIAKQMYAPPPPPSIITISQQLTEIVSFLKNSDTLGNTIDDIIKHNDDSDVNSKHKYIFYLLNRVTDMMIAKRNAKTKMARVYAGDKEFFREVTDPGGELTPEQLKEINDFWGRYSFCYDNNPDSQRYFSVLSEKFDPTYVPWGIVYGYLGNYLNNAGIYFFRDKNYLELVFPNVKQPKTVIRKMSGYYYNNKRQIISESEAVDICYGLLSDGGHEKLFVKDWEGGGGKGIILLRKNFSREKITEIFDSFKDKRFICQEAVKSHESYSVPGIPSLNTLRIITFNYNMKIHLAGVVLRMGTTADAEFDNAGAGGIFVKVNENGTLGEYGLNYVTEHSCKTERFYKHPNGYEFSGKKLFNIDKAIEKAMELHYEVPMQLMIGWDFTIDESGEPVMIELNGFTGFMPQLMGYHLFLNQEICKKLLDNWILKRFYYDRANWNWNYREYYDHIEITRYAGLKSEVTIPQSIDGKEVTAVLDYAFIGEDKKNITVPATVKTIGEKAFSAAGNSCKIIKLSREGIISNEELTKKIQEQVSQ